MMPFKPFVSRHKDFYPPDELFLWFSRQPFSTLQNYISGQSLKYIRSKQPVLVFSLPLQKYFSFFKELQEYALNNQLTFISYKHAFKIIIPVEIHGTKKEYHFLVQKSFVYPHVLISIDNLYYEPETKQWKGEELHLHDFHYGKIRLIKPQEPNMMQIWNLIVYTSLLDFTIEEETLHLIKKKLNKQEYENLELPFLRNQFSKILTSAKPSNAFLTMKELGLINWFLPELDENHTHEYTQKQKKQELLYECLHSCDAVQEPNLIYRLVAFFYPTGKVFHTRLEKDGKTIYLNEDSISASIAYRVMKRFRFPQEIIEDVYFLLKYRSYFLQSQTSEKTLKKFVKNINEKKLQLMIAYSSSFKHRSLSVYPMPVRKILILYDREKEIKVRDLHFKGSDLQELGIPQGPIYGLTLKHLLKLVKEGTLPNEKEALKQEAILFLKQNGFSPVL